MIVLYSRLNSQIMQMCTIVFMIDNGTKDYQIIAGIKEK